ncbi:MAG TPA: hypothetical protein VJP88_08160, partial [Caulobacteraceae bacterium]|nr:hypothetical protein [Caulobacteraceae bacterium]
MSQADWSRHRVLVVGPKLGPLAEQALPGAAFEIAGVESLDAPGRGPADLLVIDAGAADPARLASAIALVAHGPGQPAAIIVGAHLPANLARAIL